MSIKVMNWVFERSDAEQGQRLVLLALADYAHDDGTGAYASVKTYAAKARLSERAARYALRRLEEDGRIERTGENEAGTYVYRVKMEDAPEVRPFGTAAIFAPPANFAPEVKTLDLKTTNHSVCSYEQTLVELDDFEKPPPDPVEAVFNIWKDVTGKRKTLLTKDRSAKIKARLREGYSVEALSKVPRGAMADPWPERKMNLDVVILYRNAAQVDKFIELANGYTDRPYGGATSAAEREAWEARQKHGN